MADRPDRGCYMTGKSSPVTPRDLWRRDLVPLDNGPPPRAKSQAPFDSHLFHNLGQTVSPFPGRPSKFPRPLDAGSASNISAKLPSQYCAHLFQTKQPTKPWRTVESTNERCQNMSVSPIFSSLYLTKAHTGLATNRGLPKTGRYRMS